MAITEQTPSEVHLPLEVVALIVDYLHASVGLRELTLYAPINRVWQELVERKLYRTLEVTLINMESIKSSLTPIRQQYVKRLELESWPEPMDCTRDYDEYTDEIHNSNLKTFSESIYQLFDMVSQWTSAHDISLHISVFMEDPHDFDPETEFLYASTDTTITLDISESPLPPATCMNVLQLGVYGSFISPLVTVTLLNVLPNVRGISLYFDDEFNPQDFSFRDIPNYSVRPEKRRMRRIIEEGLNLLTFERADVKLNFGTTTPHDQSLPTANILYGDQDSSDTFSVKLRDFSLRQRAITFHKAMVNHEIFWPTLSFINDEALPPEIPTPHPRWEFLEMFHLNMLPLLPNGQWLFMKDPIDPKPKIYKGRTGWRRCKYRNMVMPRMNDIYEAAGRAALEMPLLKKMLITIEDVRHHGFEYTYEDSIARTGRRVKVHWGTLKDFAPELRVMDMWKKVAHDIRSCELEVVVDKEDMSRDRYSCKHLGITDF